MVYAVVFVTPDDVHLFINESKLDEEVRKHLSLVRIHGYDEAAKWIANWLKSHKGVKVVCAFFFLLWWSTALKRHRFSEDD